MLRQKFTKHKISKVYGAGFADWLFKSEAEKVLKLESLIAFKLDSEIAEAEKVLKLESEIADDDKYGFISRLEKFDDFNGVSIRNIPIPYNYKFKA